MSTFEIVNFGNNKKISILVPIINNSKNREVFTVVVAGAIKKMKIQVTYMIEVS